MNSGKPIDMRHTKLKPEEAALIAGEIVKPSWASRNEGIHERISFEDTLWGFEMAGGAFYKTPLRVAYVRPGSRAEKACIRMGDTVLRINGRDTSDLTLQEAHKLVLEAGINLKIVVTSPDDQVNAHYDYQDPLNETATLTAEQLKQMELERVRRALERASRCRDLPWPWVRRKWVIYKESNCYMVPSKYENKHKDKFAELPTDRLSEDFYPAKKINRNKNDTNEETKEVENNDEEEEFEEVEEEVEEEEEQEIEDRSDEVKQEENTRLENEEASSRQNESNNSQENKSSSELENSIVENNFEESQRKNSDQGSTNYEVDSNNNHVVKSKDEQTNEANQEEHDSDDNIINEIAAESELVEAEENPSKSDDDIIDSVLNDNVDKDSQNER